MELRRGVSLLVFSASMLALGPTFAVQDEPKFSIECQNLSAPEISTLLSRELGLSLVYIPSEPQTKLNLDLKGLSRVEIEAVLGKSGTVAVAPRGLNLETPLSAVQMSLQATSAKAGNVAEALRRLSQERFLFVPHDPSQAVSVDYKQVTFSQLAEILAGFGETGLRP